MKNILIRYRKDLILLLVMVLLILLVILLSDRIIRQMEHDAGLLSGGSIRILIMIYIISKSQAI